MRKNWRFGHKKIIGPRPLGGRAPGTPPPPGSASDLYYIYRFMLLGKPVTYTNWVSGHQDNFVSHTYEDCVAIIPYKVSQNVHNSGRGTYKVDSVNFRYLYIVILYNYLYLIFTS